MSLVKIYELELIRGIKAHTKKSACNRGRDFLESRGPIDKYCSVLKYFYNMCKSPWLPLKETIDNDMLGYSYSAETLTVIPLGRVTTLFPPKLPLLVRPWNNLACPILLRDTLRKKIS